MRARRTDQNHRAVTAAIRALGYPVRSLHTQGGGVEDLLVGVPGCNRDGCRSHAPRWILVEVKDAKNKRGTIRPSQFTYRQREWYAQTEGFPRLVVVSAQDAVDQLRRLTQ